jgi:hypothetical protein
MARNPQPAAPAAEPVAVEPQPGIRTSLAALGISDSHNTKAWQLGHQPAQLIAQIDATLADARNQLLQLESLASGVGADRIRALIERLA